MRVPDTTAPVSLTELAAQIVAAHKAFIRTARTALEHARHTGELLNLAKAQLGHGHWLRWLRENCDLKRRTAENYMQVASGWARIEEYLNTHPNAHLGLTEALEGLRGHWPKDDEDYEQNADCCEQLELAPGGCDGVAEEEEEEASVVAQVGVSLDDQTKVVTMAFTMGQWERYRDHVEALAEAWGITATSEAARLSAVLAYAYEQEVRSEDDPVDERGPDARRRGGRIAGYLPVSATL